MTLGPRRRMRDKLTQLPGVRPIRRPVTAGGPEFDLYYVRTGRKSRYPLVIIPGGPGMASIGHYQRLRRHTAAAGLDVIMVEHRGVGLSRRDDARVDLPPEALTIEQVVDDVAAVLDDARVDQAVIYGTSYGSYLAAGVGVRHPSRVHAMVLDSPLLGRDDLDAIRSAVRGLLWEGDGMAATARRLNLSPQDGQLAVGLYGIGGAALLQRHLDLLASGRRLLWDTMRQLTQQTMYRTVRYRNEADLVGRIGFRELNFGGIPDGLPLDPAIAMRSFPGSDTPFHGEPFDLASQLPSFDWPTVVVSGGRDLTTPPPVAERIAALTPHGTLVRLPNAGHSILDSRERAALRIAADTVAGRAEQLAERSAELDALPPSLEMRLLGQALSVAPYFMKPIAL